MCGPNNSDDASDRTMRKSASGECLHVSQTEPDSDNDTLREVPHPSKGS